MNSQKHIINKQVIEIHLPAGEHVQVIQQELSRRYREKLIPIIDDLCNRLTANGDDIRIEKLTVDLGEITLHNLEAAFAEKFEKALTTEKVEMLSRSSETGQPKKPVELLAHYLLTGTMPWWAESGTRDYLHQVMDTLLNAPGEQFKRLIREIAQQSALVQRFVYTFSAGQVYRCIQAIAPVSVNKLPETVQQLVAFARNHPTAFAQALTEQTIANTFWGVALSYTAAENDHARLIPHSIERTLEILGAGMPAANHFFKENLSTPAIRHHKSNNIVSALWQQAEKLAEQRLDATLLRQLHRVLDHPAFSRLPTGQQQALHQLLSGWQVANSPLYKATDQSDTASLARQLDQLETQLEQMQRAATSRLAHEWQLGFTNTDAIAVHNAGLVLLWPFLQRFFENLELIEDRAFPDEWARHKAACVLQYMVNDNEEELFEGQLALNKVLCGIDLLTPVPPVWPNGHEKEMADGLLEAVIAKGLYWKNLSLNGFRTSYLRREGLLRTRDGRWLLQVKKETYDVTLEKLPWSFNIVKLPWMNEILLVEWI